jgi:predicted alpha/beta superfamily hydrolase
MKNYVLLLLMLLPGFFGFAQQATEAIPKHQSFSLPSNILSETRTINVWTPPGYDSGNDNYPVLYMPDGGIQEDFPHLANTIATLIAERRIRPIILVGIENTERRRDLTGPTEVAHDLEMAPKGGGSAAFRSFIQQELFPFIDSRFRTSDSRSLIGESLAGLFTMESFFLKPELFDNYIAFDPSLWWNNHYWVRMAHDALRKHKKEFRKLWFAGSNTELIQDYTRSLADILKKEERSSLNWHYSDRPEETHASIFKAAKVAALLWTFGTKK